MNKISCVICASKLANSNTYKRHLKGHLTDHKEEAMDELDKLNKESYRNHVCEYCGKKFTEKKNLTYHLNNSCKNNEEKIYLNKIKEMLHKLSSEKRDEVANLIGELNVNSKNCNITNSKDVNVNYGNFDIDINLTVNNYGSERIDHITLDEEEIGGILFEAVKLKNKKDVQEYEVHRITKEFTDKKLDKEHIPRDHRTSLKREQKECNRKISEIDQAILECVESILIDFFQRIHIDEDHPENHNIYIPNGRARLFFVMKEKWMRTGDLKFLEKNTDVYYNYLLNAIEFLIDNTHDPEKKQKYIDGKEKIESFYQNEENKTRLEKSMAQKIFDILYQNKDILKKTFDNTKYQGKSVIPLRK